MTKSEQNLDDVLHRFAHKHGLEVTTERWLVHFSVVFTSRSLKKYMRVRLAYDLTSHFYAGEMKVLASSLETQWKKVLAGD